MYETHETRQDSGVGLPRLAQQGAGTQSSSQLPLALAMARLHGLHLLEHLKLPPP